MADTESGRKEAGRDRAATLARFRAVRAATEALARPLSPEDQTAQSMPDASPAKWHRAHTSWFFETFVLRPHVPDYDQFDAGYAYLFNSYYVRVGPRYARPKRGLLTRPSSDEIAAYRRHVDQAVSRLIGEASEATWSRVAPLIELGLHHEQQHQELLLTDARHLLSCNPLAPAYRDDLPPPPRGSAPALEWLAFPGDTYEVGHDGNGFAFDNEGPRHDVLLRPFAIASRPVTNDEFRAFVDDGGYQRPDHWLSDGWTTVEAEGWTAPAYWRERDGDWIEFTLAGERPLDGAAPVSSVSYYEAEAFAAWSGKRLPTEPEWEVAARAAAERDGPGGNLLDEGLLHPAAGNGNGNGSGTAMAQAFGDVWEWTASAYAPYPGFRATGDAIGEYNGKFMVNQMVLRGGSCATPADHIRVTYRNFFYPNARWQFSGIRLAEDG